MSVITPENRQRKSKRRKISKEGWTLKPYTDNASEVMRIVKASGGRIERASLLRELVSEALAGRRLGQIGVDESLSAVKTAQKEVVAGEVSEIKAMLKDLLALARGSGTGIDRITSQNREIYGVIFHILRTVFNIEEMSQDYLARPALEDDGKNEKEITEAFAEAEQEWSGQAQSILESVRAQMSQASI